MSARPRACLVSPLTLAFVLGLTACGTRTPSSDSDSTPAATKLPANEPSSCPREQIPEQRAPDVETKHEAASYWLAKYPDTADAPLLEADAIAELETRAAALPGGWRDPLGEVGADPELVARELDERLEWMRGRVREGKYVEVVPGSFERAASLVGAALPIEQPALRSVVSETPLWCIPSSAGLFTEPVDRDFDRNRCASLHPGELVRSLRASADGSWIYVEAGHSVGWVEQADHPSLGPVLDLEAAREHLAGPQGFLTADYEGLRAGSSFPLAAKDSQDGPPHTLLLPGLDGPVEREFATDAPISAGPLPFSRRQLFHQAFTLLEQPYGWGGREGQRDCSRYTYDLFAQFGIKLARNSGVQAKLGTRSVDVSELGDTAKREAIRAAASEGVVLLYMPGHIMIYLGQDGDHDYGISALSEFLTPCEGGEDSVHRLDKVAVTTLDVGRGTERRAFIQRITRMAIFDRGDGIKTATDPA